MPIALGVPLMDKDHAAMEALLEEAYRADEAALPGLFAKIEAETRAHFRREEELMQSAGVPILHCHIGKHEQFLAELGRGREAAAQNDLLNLRRFLCSDLPELFSDHVQTVDRVTAGFLLGQVSFSE
jgi:hemerythrin